jgi:3-methylcrotonyl-CoA carboxylase beta subunit
MPAIESKLQKDDAFLRRDEHWRREAERLREEEAEIALGGGERARERHHERGKLLARERVEALVDEGSPFLELGLWAGHGMYEEWGGAPAAGVVAGIGTVHGRDLVVVANDATVKAGAWFPATVKKILRAQEIALENRLPVVYLVDSAGVFLPLQEEIFPDKGALRPGLLQQRPPVGRGRLPDGGDHGLVRGRRGVPADHER